MSGALSGFPELDIQPVQAPNLLGMASDVAALKGQLNQNRQFAAQQAQSQLLTQNTNPDGSINVPAYQAAVRANPQAASVGAGDAFAQAQDLNGKLLANTGAGLTQHFTRLSALYNGIQAEITNGGGKGISPQTYKNTVLDFMKQGLITPQDAANAYTGVSDDPLQNAKLAQSALAGVTQGLNAITPAYQAYQTGAGQVVGQTNPNALGGASVPNITTGLSAAQLATPVTWTDANNQQHQGTLAQMLGQQGVPTAPQVSQGVPAATTQQSPGYGPAGLAPIGPQGGQGTAPAASSVPAGAPGTGGTPIAGPAPGVADIQTANTNAYVADQNDASNINPQITALTDLLAAAPNAGTGPEADKQKYLSGLGQELGIIDDGTSATELAIMDKAQSQLITNGLTGLGQATDAKMFEAAAGTPGKTMTPQAIAATGAMVLGNLLYKKQLGVIGQSLVTRTGSAVGYLAAKQALQNHTSPLILSLPYMPYAQKQNLLKYMRSLPAADQAQLDKQFSWTQQNIWNAPSQ